MLSLHQISRPALWPTQPSVQRKMVGHFLGVKPPGREADHSPSFSVDVKTNESITPISLMSLLFHSDVCGR
jgi:hypothetical protein